MCDIFQIFCALSQRTAGFAVSRGISKAIAQSDLTRDATNATRLDTTLYNAITESVVGSLKKGKRGKAIVSRFVVKVCVVAVLLMPFCLFACLFSAAHAVKSGTRPANVATSRSADQCRRLLCHLVRLLRAAIPSRAGAWHV